MPAKTNYFVFDYDGTIALNNQILPQNKALLKRLKHKVLNTSRGIGDLAPEVFTLFDKIMTLNGSLYYENCKLIHEFKTLTQGEVNLMINIVKRYDLNIAFNSTAFWQNVKAPTSQAFMKKNQLHYTREIEQIPQKVFLVAVSSFKPLDSAAFSNQGLPTAFKQSPRMWEFTHNSKANIQNIHAHFFAFGDNENDLPMMQVAQKKFWVKNADLAGIWPEVKNLSATR